VVPDVVPDVLPDVLPDVVDVLDVRGTPWSDPLPRVEAPGGSSACAVDRPREVSPVTTTVGHDEAEEKASAAVTSGDLVFDPGTAVDR
jgi:hypothetical protein